MGAKSRRLNRVRATVKGARTGQKVVMRYYARKLEHDNWIREFVVLNGSIDPTMRVISDCADGTQQDWARFEEDGRSVFLSPDGYMGGPIAWIHDNTLTVEAMVWEAEKTFSFAAG